MQKAPSFFLTAIGAARVVGGPPGPAAPLLLIFHGHGGAKIAHDVNATVRNQYPSGEQLQVASIVDLGGVPRFMRPAVEPLLLAAYRNSAKSVPSGLDPREFVLIAPDWEGTVTAAFGMTERIEDIGLVLITNDWQLCGQFVGADPQSAAMALIAKCADVIPRVEVESTNQP